MLHKIKERILAGGEPATRDEALVLAAWPDADALCDAADEVCRTLCGTDLDSCSIVNARSGRCGEDCKWCAQASRHHTGCHTYNSIDPAEVMQAARHNEREGIRRFSLVTSGRSVAANDLDTFCAMFMRLHEETGLGLCASMGLLDYDGMVRLREAGVTRYHCNLETSAEVFPTLCSTHTQQEKVETIRAARRAGLQVCSGGIIGMGETMAQRVELALTLRQVKPLSIPINLLHPIPGTPLENAAPLSEEDILRTVAVFRFVHPGVQLRFAGGRALMSEHTQLRAMRIAVNGAIVGDLLTTIGSTVEADRKRIAEAGYEF